MKKNIIFSILLFFHILTIFFCLFFFSKSKNDNQKTASVNGVVKKKKHMFSIYKRMRSNFKYFTFPFLENQKYFLIWKKLKKMKIYEKNHWLCFFKGILALERTLWMAPFSVLYFKTITTFFQKFSQFLIFSRFFRLKSCR